MSPAEPPSVTVQPVSVSPVEALAAKLIAPVASVVITLYPAVGVVPAGAFK